VGFYFLVGADTLSVVMRWQISNPSSGVNLVGRPPAIGLQCTMRKIVKMFARSSLFESEKGTKDPKVWALAILARSIGNVESALILLDNERLVEARTLVRCCYENFRK
jgi:hypothetical protein